MANVNCFAKIKGKKQGDFAKESEHPNFEDWFEVLSFSNGFGVPVKRTGGTRQTGAPSVSEITFTKYGGKASTNLLTALMTRESLETVTFAFIRSTDEGAEQNWLTIELTGGMVTSSSFMGNGADQHVAESYSIGFRKIKWANKADKMEADFTWAGK